MNKNDFFDFFLETVKNVYIKVYGLEKWNNLTDEEKHEATMIIAKDLNKIL